MTHSRLTAARAARPAVEAERVTSLASRALDVLAAARRAGRPAEAWIDALAEAATAPDAGARTEVAGQMRAAGITPEEISDLYIPAVARRLGEAWCDDRMSFADVSIGSARLQAMLRDVRLSPARDPVDETGAPMVMLLADSYHTLGAMVLTGQLRRAGASVRLIQGRSEAELDRVVRASGVDAILLSVARGDEFAAAARLVARLRALTGGRVPLIVGGGILELGAAAALAATGADHATCCPRDALDTIGAWTRG